MSNEAIERYYRFHAHIYDLTRWSFLFGRNGLVQRLAHEGQPQRVLEIGCGTGHNLARMASAFPQAHLTGLDISEAMLDRARKAVAGHASRVSFVRQPYDAPVAAEQFDLVVFSYSLTMINPGWEQAIKSAVCDLAPGGRLAVVDFHRAGIDAFRRWMAVNHVRMEGQILPELERQCPQHVARVHRAYGGVWQYFDFIGQRAA